MTAFLFDLDGTLLDSIELIMASFRHTCSEHHVDASEAEWLAGIGTPLREQLARIARNPSELEAMLVTYREHNLSYHDSMARPYPGVVEAVRELHRRGYPLAIVTSKLSHGTARGLIRLGVTELFPVTVSADDVKRGKPDPEPVLLALRKLGASPEQAVFIGDSPHDMHAGRAAGVRTAAVTWGPFTRAELQVTEPSHWLHVAEDIVRLANAIEAPR